MTVKVSAIILTSAYTPRIHRLLSSLNEQTLEKMEIVVISSVESAHLEHDIQCFTKKRCSLKYVPPETPYISMALKGVGETTGEYVVFCGENFIFESGTLEELYHQAQEQKAQIVQYQVRVISGDNVTDFQANAYKKHYTLCSGLLTQEMLIQKSCVQRSISVGIEGKLFNRSVLEKAAEEIARFGCSYEEVLWIYAVNHCDTYLGLAARQYASRELQEEDVLAIDAATLDTVIEKKKIVNEVEAFLYAADSAGAMYEEREQILTSIWTDTLRNVIALWASNRCPEELMAYGIGRIRKIWGARDMICGLASWAKDGREIYSRYLADLFESSEKEDYRCVAVFDNEWVPFPESMEDRILIRFTSAEADGNLEEDNDIVPLPQPKGALWYQGRYDAIEAAIKEKQIDMVCFENCAMDSLWDILTVKACGAHVIIDDRKTMGLLRLCRQNDANSYLKYLLPMRHAEAVVVSKWADVTNFHEMGINYTYEETIDGVLVAARDKIVGTRSEKISLYEETLLRKKYYQALNSAYYKLNQLRRVVGPYENALSQDISAARVRKAIRNALWREKFSGETLIGKGKLLLKTSLKILGVPNITLGLQSYRPPKRIPLKARLKKVVSHMGLLLHPKLLLEKLRLRKQRSLACEKRLSLGPANPRKTFYLIRLSPGNEGLLLSYLHLLRELDRFDKTNLIPVVDMQWAYYVMAHNSEKDQGKVNGWEMYFRPVAGYSLEEACRSKNVIRGQISYRDQIDNYFRTNILRSDVPEAEEKFKKWCRLDKKYMGLKQELLDAFEEEYERVIGGKRTIGVMVREGYSILNKLNYALISNHAVQPELDAVVQDLRVLLRDWGCEQVFVSAEYGETIRVFQEAFGEKVVFTQRKRKEFTATEAEEYRTKREEYYATISREEINRDYLKEVYLLSRCTCLLAGRASASIVAALWNNGAYEHRQIYDLGTYSVDTTKQAVTLRDQQ